MRRTINDFWRKNENGYAVVEATILLPIIIMVFSGLVLLSIYLPGKAQLQRATQYVATGIATARSDGSVAFDENGYSWTGGNEEFDNVYAAIFSTDISAAQAKKVITENYKTGILANDENLHVECGVKNYIIYKEIYVTATKCIKSPVNLSFVGFPETINLTVTSTAVVQNGDEFVRNMDMAVDFLRYLMIEKESDVSSALLKVEEIIRFTAN